MAGKTAKPNQNHSAATPKTSKAAEPKNHKQPRVKSAASTPLIEALQRSVANSLLLYLNYRHYHWETYGPHFRDLHLLFESTATETHATVDELAERVRILGGHSVYSPVDMVGAASVDIAAKKATMRGFLEEAHQNVLIMIEEMRAGAEMAQEKKDPGTADLFTRTVQVHEKHEWFLRQALQTGDGM